MCNQNTTNRRQHRTRIRITNVQRKHTNTQLADTRKTDTHCDWCECVRVICMLSSLFHCSRTRNTHTSTNTHTHICIKLKTNTRTHKRIRAVCGEALILAQRLTHTSYDTGSIWTVLLSQYCIKNFRKTITFNFYICQFTSTNGQFWNRVSGWMNAIPKHTVFL